MYCLNLIISLTEANSLMPSSLSGRIAPVVVPPGGGVIAEAVDTAELNCSIKSSYRPSYAFLIELLSLSLVKYCIIIQCVINIHPAVFFQISL